MKHLKIEQIVNIKIIVLLLLQYIIFEFHYKIHLIGFFYLFVLGKFKYVCIL